LILGHNRIFLDYDRKQQEQLLKTLPPEVFRSADEYAKAFPNGNVTIHPPYFENPGRGRGKEAAEYVLDLQTLITFFPDMRH
jgi:hypothetical protein